MQNILFVCDSGMNRSRTASELFNKISILKTDYCGIDDVAKQNNKIMTKDKIEWADIIFFMEKHQFEYMNKHFPIARCGKCYCLNIDDKYQYNDKDLIELLLDKIHITSVL